MFINVFLIVLFVFDFSLIYMIYFYNPSGTINRFLSLLIIPIMLSNIEMLLLRTFESRLSFSVGLNMAFLGGLTFFPIFYHFSFYYPRNLMSRRRKRYVILNYVITILLGLSLFLSNPYHQSAVSEASLLQVYWYLKLNPVFFAFYILMLFYAFVILSITIRRFVRSYKLNLMSSEKRNILMLIAGFIPTSLLMIFAYSIFLPLRSGINVYLFVSSFYTFYFIILLLSFGYVDRKAAVRTLFTYPVTIIIILILFDYGLADLNLYLSEGLGLSLSVILVTEILLAMLLLQPLVRLLESRLFISSMTVSTDFHRLLKTSSASLASIITLSELDLFLHDVFLNRLKLSVFRVMVKDESSRDFVSIGHGDTAELRYSGNGELAGKLEGYRKIMNIQQIALAWHEGEELEDLYNHKIVLIAPLFERNELIGFCLIGEPGPARAWYPAEIEELELFFSGLSVVVARCHTHERAIALEKKQASIEKMAVLSEISSGIAHEIRNPLSIITASAETLASRELEVEEMKRFASYIQEEAARVSRLLNRVLSIAVNNEISHRPVNVVLIMKRVIDLLSSRLRKKNIQVSFKHESPVIIAVIDNEVFMQVCFNLILNAIDAMSDGMILRISMEYSDRHMVRVIFANQGSPVPEDIRDRIFDPFFTTKKTGTGLGLSITQRLIKDASGEISLIDSDSETVFQILLPASPDSM